MYGQEHWQFNRYLFVAGIRRDRAGTKPGFTPRGAPWLRRPTTFRRELARAECFCACLCRSVLWLCVDALVREKIEVPSYTRLTKLILGAINRRKQKLATIIERTLAPDARGLLDGLLTQEPIFGSKQMSRQSC
jgi:hypothetical protein